MPPAGSYVAEQTAAGLDPHRKRPRSREALRCKVQSSLKGTSEANYGSNRCRRACTQFVPADGIGNKHRPPTALPRPPEEIYVFPPHKVCRIPSAQFLEHPTTDHSVRRRGHIRRGACSRGVLHEVKASTPSRSGYDARATMDLHAPLPIPLKGVRSKDRRIFYEWSRLIPNKVPAKTKVVIQKKQELPASHLGSSV